jgi:hypothetical protein
MRFVPRRHGVIAPSASVLLGSSEHLRRPERLVLENYLLRQ